MQLSMTSGINYSNLQAKMFRHLVIVFLGTLAGVLVHYYLLNSIGYDLESLRIAGLLTSTILWIALTYAMYYITILIERILDVTDQIGLRLLIGIMVIGLIAFFSTCLFYNYGQVISVSPDTNQAWISGSFSKIGIVTSIVSIVFSVILFAISTFEAYTEDKVNYIEDQRRQIDLRIMALKSQLSPHFLFNGLNTISSLIFTDKGKAENYIRDLYSTYNYALSQYDKQTVSLNDELQLVKAYLGMVNIRYGNCITLSNNIDKSKYDAQVPPFSLQTLIENALKHNRADEDHPLTIKLALANNGISVSNNKQLKELHPSSTGLGHDNLSERYKILSTKEIRIEETETHYSVLIPLIN